jgi:hypothetical protein
MPVRWNSCFYIVKRIYEQVQAINQYAVAQQKFDLTFDVDDSGLLLEFVQLLDPLENLTRLFCLNTNSISVKFSFAKLAEENINQLYFMNQDIAKIETKLLVV